MIKGEALLGRRQVSQVLDEASLNRKEIKEEKSYKRNEVSMLLYQPKIILIPKKHILGVTNSALFQQHVRKALRKAGFHTI